jgi:hypothetical protein
MNMTDKGTIVLNTSIAIWILYNRAKITAVQFCFCIISKNQFNANGCCPCNKDILGLCKHGFIYKEFRNADMAVSFVLLVKEHRHRFRRRRSFVKQGCIGKWKRREIAGNCLKI